MAKHGPRAILDVIRGDELAAAQQRPGTSTAYQGYRGTGPAPSARPGQLRVLRTRRTA